MCITCMHCGFAGLVMIVNSYIGEILEGGVVSASGMSNDSSVLRLGISRILLYTNVATLT